MKIRPFGIEDWCTLYEYSSKYNLGETCISSFTLQEFFDLAGIDGDAVWNDLKNRTLTYGYLEGNPKFLDGVCSLYRTMKPENITTTHGCAGANQLVFSALIEQGTHVITILPTYGQLYAIPEAMGGDVDIMMLKRENEFLPDLDELRSLVREDTKLIVINNPHNPSGNLIPESMLHEIAEIARSVGAYVLCDETYRHLTQNDIYMESMADIYEKGISVSSMTKVFALAGLRCGWIAAKDPELNKMLETHREYQIISGSYIDEYFAGLVLEHKDKVLARSKAIMRKNLAIVKEWIANEPHLTMVMPKAATMCMVYYDFDVDSYEMCEDLQKKESVFLMPGRTLDLDDHCFRLGFSCATQELIDGLAATSKFFRECTYPVAK